MNSVCAFLHEASVAGECCEAAASSPAAAAGDSTMAADCPIMCAGMVRLGNCTTPHHLPHDSFFVALAPCVVNPVP